MRLFVATGIFHPDSGGPATYLYHLLPEIVARGHEVRVLAFGDAPTEGYPYPLRRIPRRARLRRWAEYALAARAEMRRADLVFVNSLGLPLIGGGDVPRVLKVVGDMAWERAVNKGWIAPTSDIDRFQTQRAPWRVELLKAQRARQVRSAARVIVPSAYLRRMVIGWGAPPERVQVIYNAPVSDAVADLPEQADARARLGLGAERPLLLTAARLVPWKGIDTTIRALRRVPEAQLLIAGDGPDAPRLRALAEAEGVAGRVTFLGRVPRERLAHYFRAADYVVLLSGYEGLSHVLLESLLAGTPVIASDRGGNPEVVQHGVNGLLVPYGDADALAETLRAALDGETRARLAAQTHVGLERFSWPKLVEQTLALLETTCTC